MPAIPARKCFQATVVARLIVLGLVSVLAQCRASADATIDFFEREVRPVLVLRCQQCHGPKKQSGGLRVDSLSALLDGGDRGPAIVPGDASESVLVQAIRHSEDDLQMPPKGRLSDREKASIERWIELGAPWPKGMETTEAVEDHRSHWAFQKLVRPDVPGLQDDDWAENRVDAFIKSRLDAAGLSPSPPADRRTLIRRAHYALTGLPPSIESVQRFVADPDPSAYVHLVDRLLQSPAYGEHGARHWLDLARYSDTKGYVYAREERHWIHSWTYRNWVAGALNENMPYDRFLLLQLAADQVDDRRRGDLAAMGFLTLGRRFLGASRDIIDDRIDVVCRTMLGLTVSCARCHDHKYDPIPTSDYYSLYGVFDSCSERRVLLEGQQGSQEFRTGLNERQDALDQKLQASREEWSGRCRERVADYLHAQSELHKYRVDGFDQIFQKSDLLPAFVWRWESYLYEAKRRNDPIFVPWHAYRELSEADFAKQSEAVTRRLHEPSSPAIHSIVAQRFSTPPKSFQEVTDRYAALFAETKTAWENAIQRTKELSVKPPSKLDDPQAEQLRQVLYGPDSPCTVPDEPIVHSEGFFDSSTCGDLWKKQGEVDRWINRSDPSQRYALILVDRSTPTEPRVFRRGDPQRKGDSVPRQFLSLLRDDGEAPFQNGSGRIDLARSIIDPNNPLTARVIVNRIWSRHFGQGLVTTSSDFGVRAAPPSHPKLLDWLASQFIEEGWDLKKLHRRILLSKTFRQSSAPELDHQRAIAQQVDPENRLLWRMNPRRLSFEEFRDALLAASGQLDRRTADRPIKLFDEPFFPRRTFYGFVDRQYLPGTLRVFDFANPDLHVPKRAETTVPQQALFLMNHPLVLKRAVELAKLAKADAGPEQPVREMFQRTLQRQPTGEERERAMMLVRQAEAIPAITPPVTAVDWQYGYGSLDETKERVVDFQPLPHFDGQAWQGGPKWPDPKLGWVQLTATGGHPGNDRKHAAIRRWTANRQMNIRIRSDLVHQRPPGDGVRAFVVASNQGVLCSAKVHQDSAELNVDSLTVSAGDTIDFVVDIGDVLNSDEHQWIQTIEPISADQAGSKWNSRADFTFQQRPQMGPWEQLAQVLFCTNEFVFVD